MLRWLFLLFLAVVAACTVAAWLPAQEPAKIELHVFCLPDKDCVYCRIFHADADQSPLKRSSQSGPCTITRNSIRRRGRSTVGPRSSSQAAQARCGAMSAIRARRS